MFVLYTNLYDMFWQVSRNFKVEIAQMRSYLIHSQEIHVNLKVI